jgi:hypothetical protein
MRPRLLSRFVLAFVACIGIVGIASDVFAQTNELNKTLVRKFPEDFCPLDTQLIGSFTSGTGIIQLTFITGLGGGSARTSGTADAFSQILDDISIIEASEFAANQEPDQGGCYSDEDPESVPVFNGLLTGNPKVPFYDGFGPSTSECAWDETNGFSITDGALHYTGAGALATTSVISSGLTPGTTYVIHGRWSANDFPFATECTSTSLCLTIQVDSLPNGCGTLPVQTRTWGQIKAMYKN